MSQGPLINNGQPPKVIMSRRYNKRSQNPGGRGETQQLDAISYRLHQADKGGFQTNDRSMLNVTVAGSSAV